MRNLPFIRLQSLMIIFISLGMFYSCSTNDDAAIGEELEGIVDEQEEANYYWTSMDEGMSGNGINVFFEYEGELIAGGDGVFRWDGSSWNSMGKVDGFVQAFTIYQGDLIVSGGFTSADGETVNNIARWDGEQWQPMGLGMSGEEFVTTVSALTIHNDDLIGAGSFNHADGKPVNNIARWDGEEWQALGEGFSDTILALIVQDSQLIAAGHFEMGDNQSRVALWDGKEWQPVGGNLNGYVDALTIFDGDLIAGGSFASKGGIARYTNAGWESIGGGTDGYLWSLTVFEGDLIAGGWFTMAGSQNANHIARWNGTSWLAFGNGIIEGRVDALAVHEDQLIAGGNFTKAGGKSVNHIARWEEE